MSLAVIHRVRSSITWKFILLFTIILSVIQGTIGWITHAEMSRSTQREAERLNLQILKQANLNLSRYYQQYENIFTLTDSSADFLRWMQADPEDAFVLQTSALSIDEHTLRPYFRAHPEIVSITMYNTNGVQKIILTDRSNTRLIPRLDYRLTEDVDVEALPPGRLLQQVSAKPHYMTRSATVGPEYVITFLKKYEYRNASAVIAIDVTLDPTLEILQEMSLVEGGLGLVIDADGTIIADPTGEAMLQPLPPDVFAGIRDSPAGTYYDANGHQMLFYEEISRSDGWKLIISTPHAYLTSSVESIRNTTLLVSVLGMAAAVALIVAVSSSYIRRIVKLRRMMRLTEMGSFHHRVEVSGKDEIADLALVFNNLLERLQRADLELNTSRTLHQEAILSALQSQIHSHFLYNALESINALANLGDKPEIGHIAISLAKMLRYTSNYRDTIVTVRQEIEHLEHYLYIIGILYEESVQYAFDVEDAVLDVPCLKAVLQPIVENSVKHGLESPNAVISIRVSAQRWGDRSIRIVCADDGPGFPESKLAMLQEALVRDVPRGSQLQEMKRIGLLNVHYRLSMYDPRPETGLSVRNLPSGGAEVVIVLPISP